MTWCQQDHCRWFTSSFQFMLPQKTKDAAWKICGYQDGPFLLEWSRDIFGIMLVVLSFEKKQSLLLILFMEEILHRWRLVAYPIIYRALAPSKRWLFGISSISEPSTVAFVVFTFFLKWLYPKQFGLKSLGVFFRLKTWWFPKAAHLNLRDAKRHLNSTFPPSKEWWKSSTLR